MEQASETAVLLAQKDWGENRNGFFVESEEGTERMSEEAQDIFNEYYDQQTQELEKLVVNCIKEFKS